SRRRSAAVRSSTCGPTTATSCRRRPEPWESVPAGLLRSQARFRRLDERVPPSTMLTRLALGLIWLVHRLSFRRIARIGRAIGWLGYRLAVPRRKVVLTNLRLCFPEMTEAQRVALARRHFSALGRAFLDRSIL